VQVSVSGETAAMTNPYLDVRVAFALAKIALIVDPDDDSYEQPLGEAHALGLRDGEDAPPYPSMPAFFADEPALARMWTLGVQEQEVREDKSCMCSFCFKDHEIWDCPHL
jgi:hypothetical protein